MSFGFGIGDFIAVSQLAHRLYKDVFLVARDAPKELQTLMCEIALLSQSIDLLIEEVKNPNSILVRAGEVRVDMVNRVMMQANATLKDLEKFANKYEFGEKAGERRKVKRVWDKFKFARELSSLNELRKKVQDHNGTLMLVLTSAGNSSLERMETFNKGMMADIGGIQDMLANAPQAPVVSIIDEKVFQISLSQAFMKSAERTRPWLAIGFDEWIQAGRWWLMKSQSSLYSDLKPNAMVPPQAYADLLKASWILIDIISKHPQMKFWSPTSEYLQVQLLAEVCYF
ncbi:hypothetical protein N431DRAFT_345022 [Stipitochalara longipes BDJ]|nr:hypothetical protein N431DRAFT_345022 [Stipitochalara longipes BDJ]